jgi:hypothetical protein
MNIADMTNGHLLNAMQWLERVMGPRLMVLRTPTHCWGTRIIEPLHMEGPLGGRYESLFREAIRRGMVLTHALPSSSGKDPTFSAS